MRQPSSLRSTLLDSATCSHQGDGGLLGALSSPHLAFCLSLSTCSSDILSALQPHSAREQVHGANKSMVLAYSDEAGCCPMLHAGDG